MTKFYSDNPARDEERRQQELEERPHIRCAICGTPLYVGTDYYDIYGEPICEDCMEDSFKREVVI